MGYCCKYVNLSTGTPHLNSIGIRGERTAATNLNLIIQRDVVGKVCRVLNLIRRLEAHREIFRWRFLARTHVVFHAACNRLSVVFYLNVETTTPKIPIFC